MARSIWTGYISFGLVSIPVGLYAATEEHEVAFHQFERGTSDRIRYQRVNERTGREVDYDDIVKGHDVGGGEHVIVEPDELADIAPGRSRALEIDRFVDLADVDPIFFQKSYYLAPSDEENTSSYALLRAALAKTNRAAVATFVMRGKEYLAAIRASDDVLVLETLHFADEVRDPAKLFDDLPDARGGRKQLDMAVDLIDAMTERWQPEAYRDTYTERVKELVEAKREGKEVVVESEPAATEVTDLLTALQQSVEAAKKGRKGGGSRAGRKSGSKLKTRVDPDQLAKAPKKDLDKLARELDISGRSSMTKDELAAAIEKARKSAA
ncbi:Ku protein [Jiangella gansuensis]|uniref:non-homologous end joining protein Ku n=1 Tax=Jiangella gansuensis TaxID=281473 RepID=UPI00047DBE86|nr:Ku protein [Jiangella gansuensis]